MPLLVLLGLIWGVYLVNFILPWDLRSFGIVPRQVEGLIGIFTAPFLHGNWTHITGNTFSLIVFGGIISAVSRKDFIRVTPILIVIAGLGVWLLGRPANHIGASGLVFGYFGFIVTRGFYERNVISILVAVVVCLFFGGMIWGVLPRDSHISWEGHLFGLLGGFYLARVSYKRS